MNRTDLQPLAQERIEEAELLLNATKYSGAYYLTGYAFEFALKACIARLTNQHDFYDKEIAKGCFTHKLRDPNKMTNSIARFDVEKGVAWKERTHGQTFTTG